jgi:2,3-diaminopropionate biosynthesis protein SbnA
MGHYSGTADYWILPSEVGSTPMVRVTMKFSNITYTIHLKIESHNPMGSVKDRTAWSLIQYLERRGKLHPGKTVVESTSGNLGAALAAICRRRGYPFLAIVDPKATAANLLKMRRFGADVEMVERPDANGNYLDARLARVDEICRGSSRFVWTNQYASAANPEVHYRTTAPEIYKQMGGKVDAVFVAVSTGGTLAGIARYFRSASPRTAIIAVDVEGSVVLGGTAGPRQLVGIGSTRASRFISPGCYDGATLTTDQDAVAFCRALDSSCGIRVGGSSGATLVACVRYLTAHPQMRNVVCLCADDGDNYVGSIFDGASIRDREVLRRSSQLCDQTMVLHAHS